MTMNLLGPLAPENADESDRLKARLVALHTAAAEFRKQAQCFEADIVRFGMLAGIGVLVSPHSPVFESPDGRSWRQVEEEDSEPAEEEYPVLGHFSSWYDSVTGKASPPESSPSLRQISKEIEELQIGYLIRDLLNANSDIPPGRLVAAVETEIHVYLRHLKDSQLIYDFGWLPESPEQYVKSVFIAYNPSMECTGWLFGIDTEGRPFVKFTKFAGPAPYEKQWQDLPA
jgi:hypothetical protein